MSWGARVTPYYAASVGGGVQVFRDARIPVEARGVVDVVRDARIPVEARGVVDVFRDARIPVEASGLAEVFRDARIPLEARGIAFRDARLVVEAVGVSTPVFRDARIPIEWTGSSVVFRDARLPIEAPAHDEPVLRFVWKVLQPADFIQAFTWTVVEVVTVGGEQRFRWRVFKADPGQAFTWTVIEPELLELFESQGQGAAAGIAPDTLLPIGRATKD